MAKVTVTLNTKAVPPVSTDPKQLEIDCSGETIHWVPAKGSAFTFVALAFEGENPFSGVVVKPPEITARDNNQSNKTYNYRILVQDTAGKYYTSDTGVMAIDGPTIRNN